MTLPDGFTVRVRDDVRLLPGSAGDVTLVGGSPLRSMRVKPTAADRVAGRQVQVHDATTDLIARRLLDGNLADPAGLTPIEPAELTLIVPATTDRISSAAAWPPCAGSTSSSKPRSRTTWPLSLTRSSASTRSQASAVTSPRSSSPRDRCRHDQVPTPGHLASWAKFAPGIKSSAGKTKGNGSTGHGNRYLARVLGAAAINAGRTNTFLGVRYRRIARRRGRKKAQVAVGRSQLVIIWHLLADPTTRFHDLDPDHYDRHASTTAKKRSHLKALKALGYHVTLEPAA